MSRHTAILRLGVVASLAHVLAGCATSERYDGLVRDFEGGQSSAYLDHELQASAPPQTVPARVYQTDVEDTIRATRERWQQALADSPTGRPDRDPPMDPAYRELAHSPALPARLAEAVELDLLLALVAERNPAVQAARRSQQATLEQYPQAVQLETILQQYNGFTKQLDTTIGPQKQKQMQAMQFPFPDTLALKGQLINEEVEIAARQTEIALRDARATLRVAYYRYLFAHESLAINRENQRLLAQMIESAQSKYRVGDATYNAVVMTQIELAKLEDAIITLDEQRALYAAEINTVLGRRPDAALGPPSAPPDALIALDLDGLYDRVIEGRQELQQMRLRIARTETMVELATRMANPDPSTGASTLETRAQADPAFVTRRDLNHAATPWTGQRNAYVHETEVRIEALHQALAQQEDASRLQTKTAHFSQDRARRSIALYTHSLLPQAEQALAATAAGYTSGKASLITYLDAQRTRLGVQLAAAEAWRDLRLAQTELDRLAGGRLPRTALTIPYPAAAAEPGDKE